MEILFQLAIFFMEIILSTGFDKLSEGKRATQSTTAPCYPPCGADKAVDGDRNTCMKDTAIGKRSPEKSVWWTVDLGGNHSIYSISIDFKDYGVYENRQRSRFAGFSIYISNTPSREGSSLCYKNTLPLPPLVFNTTCIGYGRYVIYYNERLDGVTYPEEYEILAAITELCEVKVQGCSKVGVYGSNCSTPCPINCQDGSCNIVNGSCLGCAPGYIGQNCKDECVWGRHGTDCKRHCSGHCKGNISCNHVTGICDGGCAAGWMGKQCDQQCNNGTFGPGCIHNCSGHCLNGTYCEREYGFCEMGCNAGYAGNLCYEYCLKGFFGQKCEEHCSTNCINRICDHITGACVKGCLKGYTGMRCSNLCQNGHFGENCSYLCPPKCNQTCHHVLGSCLEEEKTDPQVSEKNHSVNALTLVGVLSACAAAIIIFALAVIFVRLKRKSSIKSTKRMTISLKETSSTIELIPRNLVTKQNSNIHVPNVQNRVDIIHDTAKKGRPTNKTIPVRNLHTVIAKMSAAENAGFKHEYHEIPKGELFQCEEAKKPGNKPKNRYTTTFPYDHSRVVLKTASTQEGDYINANYMENPTGKRSYIATQGPKQKTIGDFWKMVWQEDVFVIVCLTNLKEGGKNKCAQYWPAIYDKIQTGSINIRHLEERIYANYTIRRFKVQNNLKKKDREVLMFHYTRWPDHGVPDPLSLVVFHRQVMKKSPQNLGKYTLVHCREIIQVDSFKDMTIKDITFMTKHSAGIGRTGTYIALDALYREGERNGKVNVPMYVRTMRKDRMNMIQGDDQYKAVYLVLCESFNGKSRCLTTESFLRDLQEQSCYSNCRDVAGKSSFSSELQELLSLRKEYTEKDYESGRKYMTANNTEEVLPVEEFLCYLSYTKGRNNYYNAVLLQSFTENDSLISAQYPLPDYTEDFLRLIRDFDARVVVFMCPLKDLKSSLLWLPYKSEHKTVGSFSIKLSSSTNSTNFTSRNIILQSEGLRTMATTVLECKAWKENRMINDKRALLDLVKETKATKLKQKEGKILILSSDGATRCGAFCVVYNALEQLSMDQEVDIFTITRQFQVRRPEFVSTLEEYQLCHEVVAEFIQNDSVYANC